MTSVRRKPRQDMSMPSHTRSSFRMDRQIQIKNLPAIKVIYQRFRGDCQQLPPVWADFCGRMAALYPGIGLEYYGSSYDDPMIAGRERPEHPAGLSLDCPHGAGAPGAPPWPPAVSQTSSAGLWCSFPPPALPPCSRRGIPISSFWLNPDSACSRRPSCSMGSMSRFLPISRPWAMQKNPPQSQPCAVCS